MSGHTKWWIVRGNSFRLDSRLVVTSSEPEDDRQYVAGPYDDHLIAFDEMQELQSHENRKRSTIELITTLVLILLGAAIIMSLPGTG